jgi:hypothetical protein
MLQSFAVTLSLMFIVFFPLVVIGRWIHSMREDLKTRLDGLEETLARVERSVAEP